MEIKKETYNMVPKAEQEKVSRGLLSWLNQYPDKPLQAINFNFLPADGVGMSLETIQGPYKTKEYLRGEYMAQYQFRILYRVQPGNSNNNRLAGDEVLDTLADWAVDRARKRDVPDIGADKLAKRIICNARSAMTARYEDGSEDHQVLMTMEYEVF